MNSGSKNLIGRTIFRGPKGGEYVKVGDRKVYKFKRSSEPHAPPRAKSPPKNKAGRVIYRGPKGGLFVYTNSSKTKKSYTVHASNNNKARAKEAYTPPVGAPVVVPPAPVVPASGKLPTPSPRPTLSTAQRNQRLAEIRARLNALRTRYIAEKPKARKNVEKRLKLVLLRARIRRNPTRNSLSGWSSTTVTVPFCHAPATVPRKNCTSRSINLPVYKDGNPLVESGSVVAMQAKDFDQEWFRRQSAYITRLSDYDFWTVQAHTNRSHSWIGPYTYRGNIPRFTSLGGSKHITPLWPQLRKMILNGTYRAEVAWVRQFKTLTDEKARYDLLTRNLSSVPNAVKKDALELYKKDLKRIIAGAPKTKKKMIVYRGAGFDIFKGNPGHWYKLKSFCSGAYNVKHAAIYGHLFTRITVLPGSPVLFVAGTNQWDTAGEYELMVNLDTQYLIRGRGVLRHVYYNGRRMNDARVTDVIIAK